MGGILPVGQWVWKLVGLFLRFFLWGIVLRSFLEALCKGGISYRGANIVVSCRSTPHLRLVAFLRGCRWLTRLKRKQTLPLNWSLDTWIACRTRDFLVELYPFFSILYNHVHVFFGFLAGKKIFHWSSFEMSTEKGSVIGEAKVQRVWEIVSQPVLWSECGVYCTALFNAGLPKSDWKNTWLIPEKSWKIAFNMK